MNQYIAIGLLMVGLVALFAAVENTEALLALLPVLRHSPHGLVFVVYGKRAKAALRAQECVAASARHRAHTLDRFNTNYHGPERRERVA